MHHLFILGILITSLALADDATPRIGTNARGAKKQNTQQQQPQQTKAPAPEELNEDTYLDSEEALHSKKYVRRAVLSEMVKTNASLNVNSLYINHLMGFSNVWQRGQNDYAKYMSGMQGINLGYVSKGGHSFELGAEFSSVGNVYGGYRYFLRPGISIWPFLGLGLGKALPTLSLGDGPPASKIYNGQTFCYFFSMGLMIPLVDVGLRAEVRMSMYSKDRWVLTQGIGAVLFL